MKQRAVQISGTLLVCWAAFTAQQCLAGASGAPVKPDLPRQFRSTRYDDSFRKYSRTYFGRLPWKWFKAQAIQESGLKPNAVSRSGAMGLMQLMPGTFAEVRKKVGLPNSPFDPDTNIHAGIVYNLNCFAYWTEKRPLNEKLKLMFASYNAGPGAILKAQKAVRRRRPGEGTTWGSIKGGLPDVRGERHKETWDYVDKICFYYKLLQESFRESGGRGGLAEGMIAPVAEPVSTTGHTGKVFCIIVGTVALAAVVALVIYLRTASG